MAYDSARGEVVLFGGRDQSGGILNDTWVWDGTNWMKKGPLTSPPARANHAMAYDAAHRQVVLFGGGLLSNDRGTWLNDVWVWDGANWSQRFPQTSPPARGDHSLVYDAAHGQVVLFGGVGTMVLDGFNDTWIWNGTDWTQRYPPIVPPVRFDHSMAYDSAHGQVLLFGGTSVSSSRWAVLSDTWVWDGAYWTQKHPITNPQPRSGSALAYDSAHGQVVMFGGAIETSSDVPSQDTWAWDGSNWTQHLPPRSPGPRVYHSLAYDSTRSQVVLFGGANNNGRLGDVWTWGEENVQPKPTITAVISASVFGAFSAIAPVSWIEIYGSDLGPGTRSWNTSDFDSIYAPTSLDGVQVNVGDRKAFVSFISPTQVNAQVPEVVGATLQLTVTNGNQTSLPVTIRVNTTEPGLLAPKSFNIGGNQYVAAQHADGTYVLPRGLLAGVDSTPARPGETIVIYGIGFGMVPGQYAGQITYYHNTIYNPLEISFGQASAKSLYSGLAIGLVGLYQFNIVVPPVPDSDLVPLTFKLGGVQGSQTLFTAVHK